MQLPLLYAIQSMAARVGLVTGRNVAQVIADHYSRPVLWSACMLLLFANTFTAGADLAGVAASLNLFHVPYALAVLAAAAGLVIVLLVAGYPAIRRTLKWLTVSLLAYAVAGLLAKPRAAALLLATVIPRVQVTRDFVALLIGVFGGTISPYMLIWQSAQEVEELREAHLRPLKERPKSASRELRRMHADTWAGMGVSQFIEYFAFVAALMHTLEFGWSANDADHDDEADHVYNDSRILRKPNDILHELVETTPLDPPDSEAGSRVLIERKTKAPKSSAETVGGHRERPVGEHSHSTSARRRAPGQILQRTEIRLPIDGRHEQWWIPPNP